MSFFHSHLDQNSTILHLFLFHPRILIHRYNSIFRHFLFASLILIYLYSDQTKRFPHLFHSTPGILHLLYNNKYSRYIRSILLPSHQFLDKNNTTYYLSVFRHTAFFLVHHNNMYDYYVQQNLSALFLSILQNNTNNHLFLILPM